MTRAYESPRSYNLPTLPSRPSATPSRYPIVLGEFTKKKDPVHPHKLPTRPRSDPCFRRTGGSQVWCPINAPYTCRRKLLRVLATVRPTTRIPTQSNRTGDALFTRPDAICTDFNNSPFTQTFRYSVNGSNSVCPCQPDGTDWCCDLGIHTIE